MAPNSDSPARNSTLLAAENDRARSSLRSISGAGVRRACQANPASMAAPEASGTITPGWPKPPSRLAWASPYSSPASAGDSSSRPATSNRRRAPVGRAGSPRQASTSPARHIGTFT